MEQMKQQMMHVLDIQLPDDTEYMHVTDLSTEVDMWRRHHWQNGYLSRPQEQGVHVTLSGTPVDKDLVHLASKCKKNRTDYCQDVVISKDVGRIHRLEPVFIFTADRDKYFDISRRRNEDIKAVILGDIEVIRDMGAEDVADALSLTYNRDIKDSRKSLLLTFLRDVAEVLQNLTDVFDTNGTSGGPLQ
ncbi:uncharacterized protein LOC125374616 [Haliotis rufescens]|uniref:uncharacterized protein LOC125374616 n=1 Tax=Haliotis rufescens TaxID=6454 RepID=UPI00201F2719|nr:uncharacterized protein LOC125374616 [Haliotis rufescens]